MNILIDNSGYHLKNLGDVAMLQAATIRIKKILPKSEIKIICSDKDRLETFFPGTTYIDHQIPNLARNVRIFALPHRLLPAPMRSKVHIWEKKQHFENTKKWANKLRNTEWLNIISNSDVVIATGGGFLTDSFNNHATGILENLKLAQHLNKPTAVFGQGIGPIDDEQLLKKAKSVLQNTNTIGLRESIQGFEYLKQFNIAPEKHSFTGDDALELITRRKTDVKKQIIIGLTVRVSGYSNINHESLIFLRNELKALKTELSLKFCPLPIDFVEENNNDESQAIKLIDQDSIADFYQTPQTPENVIDLANQCSVTITGSYHSALFSLSQGVPVVGIQSNDYYSSKFEGLKKIYSKGVLIYNPLKAPKGELISHVKQQIGVSKSIRETWISDSGKLCDKGRNVYSAFLLSSKEACVIPE